MQSVDALPIPYAYAGMAGIRHPSVSTQSAVYFTVNPSYEMFRGFASGCATQGYDWQLQFSALSSFAPIRIWIINPFVYCPQGDDGRLDCKQQSKVRSVKIDDAFTEVKAANETVFNIQQCSRLFVVEVSHLEFINRVSLN